MQKNVTWDLIQNVLTLFVPETKYCIIFIISNIDIRNIIMQLVLIVNIMPIIVLTFIHITSLACMLQTKTTMYLSYFFADNHDSSRECIAADSISRGHLCLASPFCGHILKCVQ